MVERFRNYEHDSGRESKVRIKKGEKLGEGSMGKVHEVKAKIRFEDSKKELSSLVIKKYKDDEGRDHATFNADVSLRNYALLKKLKFPVPPTYRLDRDTNRILMTNLNVLHPDSIPITTSENAEKSGHFIRHIDNFEDIIREALEYADAATANNIDLAGDAYTLTVPRSGSGSARLFFTDLESIDVLNNPDDDRKARLRTENIEWAQEFL